MRFIHLADLHIGKRVNEFSMMEDQRYILGYVLELVDEQKEKGKAIDGVLIAGDVYDKPVPAAEAVQLLDWFLTELVARNLPVYMVSGNHDSGERLSFGAHLLEKSRVFLRSVYDGCLEPIELEDSYGKLNLYMLPFVKPAHVRKALDDDTITTYQDAVCAVLEHASVREEERNILIAHQMVTGAQRCDSEEISIGGLDNIDADVFDIFDYVALGHLHGPQKVGRDEVRYAGTLLKYSFSECVHKKSVTIVEFCEKGKVSIETIPLVPLRDMRQIEGRYEEVMSREYYKDSNKEDYLKIVLTDEEEIPDVLGRLRTVYPNIMKLVYNNTRTRSSKSIEQAEITENKQPIDYLEEFYEVQNNQKMSADQQIIVSDLIAKIWG